MSGGVVLSRPAVVAVGVGIPGCDALLEPVQDVCPEPGSWSLTKTDAEMCIAETRTIPSVMAAAARQASTSSVMSMISWRLAVRKVR